MSAKLEKIKLIKSISKFDWMVMYNKLAHYLYFFLLDQKFYSKIVFKCKDLSCKPKRYTLNFDNDSILCSK